MNIAPQFSLRWNNYINHITDAFTLLRLDNDLVDVTLCCEGGKIKAHKMLLSACSTYFRQVFKENPCQHPVIIFKNVKFEDLTAIINFMYHGEVNIFQAQLESFLITAELLEVKGLTDNVDEEESRNKSKLDENLSLDLSCKQKNDENIPLSSLESDAPMNLATIQAQRNESMPSSSVTHTVPSPPSNNEDQVELQTENLSIYDTSNGNQSIGEEMQVDNQNHGAEDLSEKSSSGQHLTLLFNFTGFSKVPFSILVLFRNSLCVSF